MTTDRSSRSAWTASRDEAFFRIVQAAFPAAFLAGATALLASCDDLCEIAALCEVAVVLPQYHGPVGRVAQDALA